MPPRERESPAGKSGATSKTPIPAAQFTASSQQVSWWDVHLFVQPLLAEVGSWPMAGSVAWCNLADDDPRKWAALLDAAQHWALRVETCQVAECQASSDVSAAADWGQIGRQIRQHNEFYAEKPWLRRAAS
jgi:Protein of unknown function (DUF2742)